jgi:hypothetical protein
MRRLVAVEEAKALLTEAIDWSIWRWMTEKGRVREVADRGTASLDEAAEATKASWSSDLKKAYRNLEEGQNHRVDPKIKAAAQRVKEANDEAYRARMDAEQTFDEAERRLSASMAREGARKALLAYDLREKAIRKAEAAGRAG